MIKNTCEFRLNSCIIVIKNFALSYCSGNILDACTSENLFQPEYFLFRTKPTAAPWASKRSMATYCSQFQTFKHCLKSSFSSVLPRSFSRNVFFILAVNKRFLRIFGENIHNKACIKNGSSFMLATFRRLIRLTAKLDFGSCEPTESLQGWAA